MSAIKNFWLKDLSLSVQAGFYDLFGRSEAERATLQEQLSLRQAHYPVDHRALVEVHEALAGSFLAYSRDYLLKADEHALEALRILAVNNPTGKASFSAARLTHIRAQIRQRLNQPVAALELGEDALALYNKTKLICPQRAALMNTLVHLHRQVGSEQRANTIATELKALNSALMTMSARRRF